MDVRLLMVFGIVLFVAGALITCLNFYLSFLRYPVHLLSGGYRDNYRWVSGLPLFGSLLLWISMPLLRDAPSMIWWALVVSMFDTAGLHWFVGVVLWQALFGRRN